MTTQENADALIEEQKVNWPLMKSNWDKLVDVRLKQFEFDGFSIRIQCNPRRIISSAAKVDRVSIEKRSCFLCMKNRAEEQNNVIFGKDYEILCNPFPIFKEHFTIARTSHTPQVIEPEFSGFLDISRELPNLVVFYNGPSCGASAPDHMHFQAGNQGLMPLDSELEDLKLRYGKDLSGVPEINITAVDDGLRRFVVLESMKQEPLNKAFSALFGFLKEFQDQEPMINMLSYYRNKWQIVLFPRELHRPWQYFEEGEKNILLSPASVDMGGTLITPMEKDFEKITREDIRSIFSQVSFSASNFKLLAEFIQLEL